MEGIIIDELKVYRGDDYTIKNGITIHQPTLNEICDYGERSYWSMIYTICSVPADMKWQLNELDVDYTKMSDWELFYNLLYKNITPKNTSIILGDFDLSQYQPVKHTKTNEVSLRLVDNTGNVVEGSEFGEYSYICLTEILRKIHGLKRNDEVPVNEITRQILIEDAKEEFLRNKDKEYHSQLKNLVSTLINCEGFKFNHFDVWDMKINAFMDAVSRIQKISNANLLMQSGYSGFGVDLKKINKEQLNWFGELK